MTKTEGVPHELDELASEVGEFICYWGFKKIHGRIWTHVYLSESPLDAGQLLRRLGVSKALISLSINDLLQFGVIRESEKSPRGTQTYIANPNVLEVIFNVLRRRERKILAKAETSHKLLASITQERVADANLSRERIEAMGHMIGEAQNALSCILDLAILDFAKWQGVSAWSSIDKASDKPSDAADEKKTRPQ